MRKYFLSFVALAAGLFATSCQESIVEPQIAGPTTFTVQLPDQMGTKAFGDSTSTNATINSLFVEVYSEDGSTLVYEPEGAITVSNGKATFTANLIQDQKYDIIFWAQKGNAYNTSDLRSIPMENRAHNVDDGAAFFAFLNDFVPAGASQSVVLRRPFAQLNLGTTDESLVTNAGTVKLSQSSIQVEKVAATFNTVLGVGEGEQTVQFALANVPTIKLNVGGVEYNYVSMDYLPIAGDDQALVNVNAQITLDNGQVIDHTFTSVPVRENYRTNIVGNLISSTTDFNITIEEGFVEDESNTDDIVSNEYLVVDNVAAANTALSNDADHIAINMIESVTSVLNLNNSSKETLYIQLPDADATLKIEGTTVKNLYISVPNTTSGNPGFDLTINTPNAHVELNGYGNSFRRLVATTSSNTLVLSGVVVEEVVVEQGNVVVENNSDVNNFKNESESEINVSVDATSDVNVDDETTEVIIVDAKNVKSIAELQQLINTLQSDEIQLGQQLVNTEDIELNLKGKNIYAIDNNSTGSYGLITNKANLTIVGPGTISLSATNNRGWNAYSSVISNQPGGNLTVGEGVVIEHLGGTDMAYGIDNLTNGKGTSAIATIDGATVKSTYRAIRQFLNGIEATNELYVKAESTILNTTGTNKGIWMQDPSKNANTGKLVVEEGAHVDDVYLEVTEGSTEWPVEVSVAASSLNEGKTVISENVPEGYCVILLDGIWTVRENTYIVNNVNEFKSAITKKNVTIYVEEGEYDIESKVSLAEGISLIGLGNVTLKNTWSSLFFNTQCTLKNISIENINFANNTILDMAYAEGTVYFKDCVFSHNRGNQSVHFDGKDAIVTFEGCTLYGRNMFASSLEVVKFIDCKILESTWNTEQGNKGVATGWSGVNMWGNYEFENCTFGTLVSCNVKCDGVKASFINCKYEDESNIYKLVRNGGNYDAEISFNSEEVIVYNGLLKKNLEYYVSNSAGLERLNGMFYEKTAGQGVCVTLLSDIDYSEKEWTMVDSHADTKFYLSEIDGQGHTISNLTIKGQAMFSRFAGFGDVTIKNLKFDNANVNSNGKINTSILTVQSYQNILLDNVDVVNSMISGGYKVAPLIATVYNENPSKTITATLKNCDVIDVEVTATLYDFCTTGMVAFVYAADNDAISFENCTISNVKLYAPDDSYKAHAAIYTTGSESLYNEADGVTVTNVTFEAK